MRSNFRLIANCLLCVAGIARMASAAAGEAAPNTGYLTEAEKVALFEKVPPPPEAGSEQDKADLAAVLKAQDVRTPDQIASIKAEAVFKIELMIAASGVDVNEKDYPVTWGLLVKADLDVTDVYHRAKSKWQRQRPFRAHSEVKNVADANGFGYPSGHSTRSATQAAILGELFPAKQEALLARAVQISQDRVSGGEHYPTDIEAGQNLGQALYKAISAKKEFLDDLEAAKIELKKAGKR